MDTFYAIGCMSGSSLDGLDLCYVKFLHDNESRWRYQILAANTEPYNPEWTNKLATARERNAEQTVRLHIEYGHFIGNTTNDFIERENIKDLDCVSSHGHTIFHQPENGFTFQLGDGETSAAHLKQPFVCNFRNKDIALGGQGAPFVPNGERFLFSDNDICINLGGIANIGAQGVKGYDICPCNYVSNYLAKLWDPNLEFDVDGCIAKHGKVVEDVLKNLDDLEFYKQASPKSLGAEWIESNIMPILCIKNHSIPDLMRTYTEHVVNQLTKSCIQTRDALNEKKSESNKALSILITGGGALNTFLMECFQIRLEKEGFKIAKPDKDTICYKEALIFAFLGLRCLLNEINIFCDVTGSSCDSISGSIHRPVSKDANVSRVVRYLMKNNQ